MAINGFFISGFPVRVERTVGWKTFLGTGMMAFEFPMVPEDYEALMKSVKKAGSLKSKKNSLAKSDKPLPIQEELQRSGQGEVTLTFRRGNGKEISFKRCVVLGESEASTPFHRIIRIGDLRARWPNNEVYFNVNERRVSGRFRVISPHGLPLAIQQIAEDLTYAKLSMFPGPGKKYKKAWTAVQVIEEVLSRVIGEKGKEWKFDPAFSNKYQSLVQDFVIADKGNVAVAKALGLIPGADIYQDPEGVYIVTTRFPGLADKIIQSIGDPLQVGGFIRKMNKSAERFSEFHGLFERDIGFRFDANDTPGATRADEDPWCECVLKSTEPTTTLVDGTVVPTGTYVPEAKMLAAYTLGVKNGAGSPAVKQIVNDNEFNVENVNKYYIANLDRVYTMAGALSDAYDEVVGRHIQEIKGGHRQQYQMNPRYVDACIKIQLKAPGFIDPENGSEQESPVFTNNAVLPTAKALAAAAGKPVQEMAFNFFGGLLPITGGQVPNTTIPNPRGGSIKNGKQAQARASWISQPMGIFRIDFKKDPMGFQSRIVPSAITNDKIPTGDYFGNVKDFNFASLNSHHTMNIIVSLNPRVPNNDKRLHRVVVTPNDIKKRFGVDVSGGIFGPFEDRVSPGILVGQWPYNEEKYNAVRELLGIIDGPGDIGLPMNQKELVDITESNALASWLPQIDHFEGSKTIPMRNDIPLRSEIESVSYSMTTKMQFFSIVECDAPLNSSSIQPEALFTQSTRRIVQKAVNVTGA